MYGNSFNALVEFVQERETGDSFAIATIASGDVGIRSRQNISFTSQLFVIDGHEYRAADLKGKLFVWQGDKKTVVEMPDKFSPDMAGKRVRQILDALSRDAEDL